MRLGAERRGVRGRRSRRPILVCPDKFKGTFDAAAVARALGEGIRAAGRAARLLPLADGGDGTARVLAAALDGELRRAECTDPLGRRITAEFALLRGGEVAVVDAAAASGLSLLRPDELDPWRATTTGTGELIVAADRAGAGTVVVGAGGSATVDGGEGAVDVLRAAGDLPRLIVACDAQTPWERAAEVYGPQKGADAALVERLSHRLEAIAAEAPRDPRGVPMTGCAGGLSGALWAHFGAELVSGAEYVLDATGFDVAAAEAASIVTGEGSIDSQTLEGKVVGMVAARARELAVPCDAVAAHDRLTPEERRRLGLRKVLIARTLPELEEAGRALTARAP